MAEIELDHVQIAAPPGWGAPIAWDEALPGERRFYSADPWRDRIEFIG